MFGLILSSWSRKIGSSYGWTQRHKYHAYWMDVPLDTAVHILLLTLQVEGDMQRPRQARDQMADIQQDGPVITPRTLIDLHVHSHCPGHRSVISIASDDQSVPALHVAWQGGHSIQGFAQMSGGSTVMGNRVDKFGKSGCWRVGWILLLTGICGGRLTMEAFQMRWLYTKSELGGTTCVIIASLSEHCQDWIFITPHSIITPTSTVPQDRPSTGAVCRIDLLYGPDVLQSEDPSRVAVHHSMSRIMLHMSSHHQCWACETHITVRRSAITSTFVEC